MRIERFEVGGGAGPVSECYEIFRATRAAGNPDIPVPPPGVFRGWLQAGWVGDPRETWLLAGEDGVDGWYLLELPSRDNKHLAGLELMVRPGRERRGVEDYVGQIAAISAVLYDAPHDPSVEPWAWDATRVRDAERRMRLQGVWAHTVAARHDASGELVGFTMIEVGPEQPDWGFQALTAVVGTHRGHRLGLLLKLAMMDRLAAAEPQVTRLLTSNSATNEHMIAVNEALGYRVIGRPYRSWELAAASVVEA